MKKIRKPKVSNVIFVAIIIAILCFCLNYRLFIIATGSMEPTYRINELILVEKANDSSKTYNVGDVVTYYDSELDATVTHRIVEIVDDGFYTKGDNNNTRDLKTVTQEQIIGKVVYSSLFLGNLYVQYRWIIVALLILAIFLFDALIEKPIQGKEQENDEIKAGINN